MQRAAETFRRRAEELVGQMTLSEKFGQFLHLSKAVKRLNIDEYVWWNEGLHGLARQGRATSFPQSIGLAATFDPALVKRIGDAVSDEGRAKYNAFVKLGDRGMYKGLTFWSPNINIFRDPRWGRGHETYGEDPYLTFRMGEAYVKGLQGDPHYRYRKADATLKHFVAHSGPESLRTNFDAEVSEKDFRETYLYAFRKIIAAARPAAVMAAYNLFNGVPCSCNERLLGEVLRKELGFRGYTVSDCGAISLIYDPQHYAETPQQAAALALRAGLDLNCGAMYERLKVALEEGLIEERDLDRSLVRLLTARLSLGMFDDDNRYDKIPLDVVECAAHRRLCLRAARESLVLLKNNGILPLGKVKKLAVVGPNANAAEELLGNYNGTPSKIVSILRGIQEGFPKVDVLYSRGCGLTGELEYEPVNDALLTASQADAVVFCCGLSPRLEGEAGDAYNSEAGGDKTGLVLPEIQLRLFRALRAQGKPLVVVNVTGSAVLLNEFERDADAVIQAFYPGQSAGTAVADVLSGRCNPSGKLPVTFYRSDEDLPPFEDYSMRGRTYRYFGGEVLYPFGYGLTYSHIAISAVRREGRTLTVTLTNDSDRAGTETVQLYARVDAPETPLKRLCKFVRVRVGAHQERTVRLTADEECFRYFDADGAERTAEVCEVAVGLDSRALRPWLTVWHS